MYGLIKKMKLIKRAGRTRAVALAAFILLAALPLATQGQNTYRGTTVVHAGSIGLVPGQSISIAVPNYYFLDGSVKFAKHSIKVYTENQSKLIYSGESGELGHEVGHIFTFRHEHLSVAGEPGTGRVQLWIEVESFPLPATEKLPGDRSATVQPPTFELIDDQSGRTVLSNAFGKSVSLSLRARPELSSTNQ